MTDNFNYQDVFQTNIPKPEHDITLQAEYLLTTTHFREYIDDETHKSIRESGLVKNGEYSQAFWELKDEKGRVLKSLAITAGRAGLVIGLDRRPTSEQPEAFRKSLHDQYMVFDPNPRSQSFLGTTNEKEVQLFYDTFYDTVASMGLHNRLRQLFNDQNESDEAILANAA
jgi:hypothetical protein